MNATRTSIRTHDPANNRIVWSLAKTMVKAFIFLCATIAIGFLAIVQPGGDGVLASLSLEDGSQYMITQHCNWSLEPYTVAFYMRSSPDQPWGWCYMDHEGLRWRRVTMTHDTETDVITVYKAGVKHAAFDRNRSAFWIPNREVSAPQSTNPPPFEFPR